MHSASAAASLRYNRNLRADRSKDFFTKDRLSFNSKKKKALSKKEQMQLDLLLTRAEAKRKRKDFIYYAFVAACAKSMCIYIYFQTF